MNGLTKSCKGIIAALLAVLIIASCAVTAFAADAESAALPQYVTDSNEKALWADCLNVETNQNIEAVKWYEKDGKYYWFLPSSADLDNLTVYHSFGSLTVNGTNIVSGQSYNIFKNNEEYSVVGDGTSYTLCVQKANGIGSMFFTTVSGSMDNVNADKDHKESGKMVVVDYDGTVSYDNDMDSIKGRGNSTWRLDKKPYNIKLAKKAALMGMDKSKKWCLLANAQEHSMIRNTFMYDLGKEVGLDFAGESRFVDVYANGEYLGTYQLTEKVEIGDDNLVKITDLEGNTEDAVAAMTGQTNVDLSTYSRYSSNGRNAFNIPANPKDITGGYLIEYVMDRDDPSNFTTNGGQGVNLKGPEYCSAAQINYIADFVQDMEDAIYSSTGYNSKGKHYSEYIDTQSAALMYLMQEFSVNVDGGISSCFFYKDSDLTGDGKLHASPCWDFDVALGNLRQEKDGVSMTSNDKWFAKNAYRYSSTRTIFAELCSHEEFYEEVEKLWKERFVPAFNIAFGNAESTGRLKSLETYGNLVESSSKMNYTRWNLSNNLLVPAAGTTHEAQLNYLKNWITGRYNFMNTGLLDIDSAKEAAKTQINSKLNEYKNSGYDSEIIAKMTNAAQQGIKNIEAATTSAQVNAALESALKEMAGYVENIVYFDNSQTKWENVYVYLWGGTEKMDWPGVKMTDLGDGIFKYNVKSGNNNIIFSNGLSENQGKTQTADLQIDGNNKIFKVDLSTERYDDGKKAIVYNGNWEDYRTTPPIIIYGDVNKDDAIDLFDIMLMQKQMAELITFTDDEKEIADVNGDSYIDLHDILLMQKHIAELITQFPVETK